MWKMLTGALYENIFNQHVKKTVVCFGAVDGQSR